MLKEFKVDYTCRLRKYPSRSFIKNEVFDTREEMMKYLNQTYGDKVFSIKQLCERVWTKDSQVIVVFDVLVCDEENEKNEESEGK